MVRDFPSTFQSSPKQSTKATTQRSPTCQTPSHHQDSRPDRRAVPPGDPPTVVRAGRQQPGARTLIDRAPAVRPQTVPAPGRRGLLASRDPPAPASVEDPAHDPRTNRPDRPPPGQGFTRWKAARLRRRPVQRTQHRRTRVRAPQATARHRHPSRQTRHHLPRRRHPRRHLPQSPHPHLAHTP